MHGKRAFLSERILIVFVFGIGLLALGVLVYGAGFAPSNSTPTAFVVADTPSERGQGIRIIELPDSTPSVLALDELFGPGFTFVATAPDSIAVDVRGTTLTLTPEPGFIGERIITVYASDGEHVLRERIKVVVGQTRARDSLDDQIARLKEKAQQAQEPIVTEPPASEPQPPETETPELGQEAPDTEPIPDAEPPAQSPEPQTPDSELPTGVQTVALNEEVTDVAGTPVGKKIADEPDYETHFVFVGAQGNEFVVTFYHDFTEALPVWTEGTFSASASTASALPYENVTVTLPLENGRVPFFRLHIGATSETFEFGGQGFTTQAVPAIQNVDLNSSNVLANDTNQNLTAFILNATDADGQAVRNITDFRINGISWAAMNFPFETNVTSTTTDAIRDYSTFARNATLGNGTSGREPVWNLSGRVGGAYVFDGIDDVINTSLVPTLQNFTYLAWIRPKPKGTAVVGTTQDIVSKREYFAGAFTSFPTAFQVNATATGVICHVDSGNDFVADLQIVANISPDVWSHVACSYNSQELAIYVNGVRANNATGTVTLSNPSFPYTIGSASRDQGGGVGLHRFNGTIDEVMIFNRSLSAAQILALFQAGNSSKHLTNITSEETAVGQIWSVAVTPNDNEPNTDGATVLSNNVTIQAGTSELCGSTNTSVTLVQNVSSNGTCYTVMNNSVTIDCNGFTITYGFNGSLNDTMGINITSVSSAVVTNCVIQKGNPNGTRTHGIGVFNTTTALIENNTVTNNGTRGESDAVHVAPINDLANELVINNGNLNNPFCPNTTSGINNCDVCFNQSDLNPEGRPRVLCTTVGKTQCPGGEDLKSTTLVSFNVTGTVASGRAAVIGGEYVACRLNQVLLNSSASQPGFTIKTRNNCGVLVFVSMPGSAFVVGQNNFTCDVVGAGDEEDNGFKLTALSYVIGQTKPSNITIRNNNLTADGGNNSRGVFLEADNSTVSFNNITTAGSDFGHGILLERGSVNNSIVNNSLLVEAPSADGVRILESTRNVFQGNTFVSTTRAAVHVGFALDNIFSSSEIPAVPTSLFIDEENGTINYTQSINFTSAVNLSQAVTVAFNATLVNTTGAAALNRSALLEFYGLPADGINPVVDLEDDGTFASCDSGRCTQAVYNQSSGILRYNVSEFTTYAGAGISACVELDRGINETKTNFTLLNNVSSGGTCFTITGSNVTLNCNGFTIYYANLSFGNAIASLGTRNLLIENCTLIQVNPDIGEAHAINLTLVNDSTVRNNTITTNGPGSRGIDLVQSANITVTNNRATTLSNTTSFLNSVIDTANDVGEEAAVKALNRTVIFVSYLDETGDFIKFAKSTDAGRNFTITNIAGSSWSQTDSESTSIDALNATEIYVSFPARGRNLSVAKSTDGGSSWTVTSVDEASVTGKFSTVRVVNSTTAYVVYFENGPADQVRLATTSDAGASWSTSTIVAASGVNNRALSFDAVGERNLYAAFTNGTQVLFANSSNAGASWTTRLVASFGGSVFVDFISLESITTQLHYFARAQGESGDRRIRLAKSTNEGASWSDTQIVGSQPSYHSVTLSAIDENTLFLGFTHTGAQGSNSTAVFSRSLDGGVNWPQTPLDTGGGLDAIDLAIDAVDAITVFGAYHDDNTTTSDLLFAKAGSDAGIFSQLVAERNTLAGNQLAGQGFFGTGIALEDANNFTLSNNSASGFIQGAFLRSTTNSLIADSNLSSTQDQAVRIIGSQNNSFFNVTLRTNRTWLSTDENSSLNNLSFVTFDRANGGITVVPVVSVPNNTIVTLPKLNVSFNNAFLNSTNLSFLNVSSLVLFKGVGHINRSPTYDPEDDNVFIACPASICTILGTTAGDFAFNVTHFTSFSSVEGGVNLTLTKTDSPDPVNASSELNYTVIINVTAGNASNITLTDIYPNQTIFNRSQPDPVSGTNNTFVLGNLSEGTAAFVNITVFVINVSNGTVINNSANISFQNTTGNVLAANVAESTTVLSGNNVPSITKVDLNSTNVLTNDTNQNLTAFVIGATDLDNDPVRNITDFRRNNESIALLNMPFETNVSSTATGAIRDYSTFVNNGTLGGGASARVPVWNLSGRVGGAHVFDGINDLINISNRSALNITGNTITLEAWVRAANLASGANSIITKFGDAGLADSYLLRIDTNRAAFYLDIGGFKNVTSNSTLSAGVWYHLVGTYDGAFMRIYINGTLDNATPQTGTIDDSISTVKIGAPGTAVSGEFFNGTIDEARIYNRSLSAGQVLLNFRRGNASRHVDTIHFSETETGEVWQAAVTPNDNEPNTDGATVLSNNVTIQAVIITSCPVTINANTTLTQNLASNGTCITFGADNIALDCAGFTLTYGFNGSLNDTMGINITSVSNAVVTNCVIQKGNPNGTRTHGIGVFNTTTALMENNTITNNGTRGESDAVHVAPINDLANELVINNGNLNNPFCPNTTTGINTCDVCFNQSDLNPEGRPRVLCTNVGRTSCPDGEDLKATTLVSFNVTGIVASGRAQIIGGEYVACRLNQVLLNTSRSQPGWTIGTRNNCGILVSIVIPGPAFVVGQNNFTCDVRGAGEEEDNGFKLSSLSYVITQTKPSNIIIRNNNLTADGGNNSRGVFLEADNSTVSLNNITTTGTDFGHGIFLQRGSTNNSIANNSLLVEAPAADGVRILESTRNVFQGNTFVSTTRAAVHVGFALDNIFSSSEIPAVPTSLFIDDQNGTINYTQLINFTAATNLSRVVRVAFNATLVNTSDAAAMNRSALLEFYGLPADGINPVVDLEDDGTFASCDSGRCTQAVYNQSSGILRYNVSEFTTYSGAGISACAQLDLDLNQTNATFTLLNNISSNGTCINVTGGNITFDCAGRTILGNGSGFGIAAINVRNITVRDCTIVNFTSNIFVSGTNNSRFFNNTLLNATGDNLALSLSTQNTVDNNTINVSGSGSDAVILTDHTFASFRGNVITNPDGDAVFTTSSTNLTFINNTVNSSGGFGMALTDCVDSVIEDNAITVTSTSIALRIDTCDNSRIINNTANSTSGDALFITTGSNYNVTNNRGTASTSGAGVSTSSISNSFFINNHGASGTSGTGFLISGATNVIINSTARSGTGDGFFVDSTSHFSTITEVTGTTNGTAVTAEAVAIASHNNNITNITGIANGGEGIRIDGRNNTVINVTGRSNASEGIIMASHNNTLYNAIGNSTTLEGIAVSGQNNTLENITGETSSNEGILIGAAGNKVTNASGFGGTGIGIQFSGAGDFGSLTNARGESAGSSVGVDASGDSTNYTNVTAISVGGTGLNNPGANNLLNNVSANSSTGIGISATGSNQQIFNSRGTSGTNFGIAVSAAGSVLENATGQSTSNRGLFLAGSGGYTLTNNKGVSESGVGMRVQAASNQVRNITLASNTGIALEFAASNNNLSQVTLFTNGTWITAGSTNSGNNLTNTTFEGANGSINNPLNVTVPVSTNATLAKLNITFNAAFLNSTNLSFLNTSGIITLRDLVFVDPFPTVDQEDDNTFITCPSEICTELGFAGGVFVYNVTQFTTYSSSEGGINVTLTKTDSPDPVNASTELNYTIIINVTTDSPANVTLTDIYPNQTIFNRSQPDPVSGTNNTFVLGNLTNGTEVFVNITVFVINVTNGAVINNTANISFQNATGQTLMLNVTESTTVLSFPLFNISNLSIIKTDTPDPVNASSELNYTINVTSNGNGTAFNVTVNDTYPLQVVFNRSQPTPTTGNNSWVIGNISAGNSVLINVTVFVLNVSNGAVINNTANATFQNETGTVLSVQTAQSTTVLNPQFNLSDLLLIKLDATDPVNASSELNYTINVTSIGNGTAYNVTVNDTYPLQVVFNRSQPTPTTGNNSWILGNLTPGTTIIINVTVFVLNVSGGTVINNTANATFQNETGTVLSVQDTQSTTVLNPQFNISNLSIVKSDNPDPVENSTFLNYTINVTSTGNGTAFNVTVNETYPGQVVFINASPQPTTGNNSFVLGNLTPGQSVLVNITVNVTGIGVNNTLINNTVNATFQNETGAVLAAGTTENTTVTVPAAPAPSPGGGGGGGGGGPGPSTAPPAAPPAPAPTPEAPAPPAPSEEARAPEEAIAPKEAPCFENWACEPWGVCQNGVQFRQCTDLNACNTTQFTPAQVQACTTKMPASAGFPAWRMPLKKIPGWMLSPLILLLLLLLLLQYARRHRKKQKEPRIPRGPGFRKIDRELARIDRHLSRVNRHLGRTSEK